jgi:hypothetical protein
VRRLQVALAREWDDATPQEAIGTSLMDGCAPPAHPNASLHALRLIVTTWPLLTDAFFSYRCNPHLADALNWLATAAARQGRAGEAEAAHAAAFDAVTDLGLIDLSNRVLHALHYFRAARNFGKHKALLRLWLLAIDTAARSAPPAHAPPPGSSGGDDDDDVASPAPRAAGSGTASAGGECAAAFQRCRLGAECELDCLQAACSAVQERMLCYAARGKAAKAAAMAGGPLLALTLRAEAFPLRGRPGQPGATLPPAPAWNAADTSAQLWRQSQSSAAAARFLHMRVGIAASLFGWRGWEPPPRDAWPLAFPFKALCLQDGWKSLATGGGGEPLARGGPDTVDGWLPADVAAFVAQRTEAVLADSDGWAPAFTAASPPPCEAAAGAAQGAAGGLAMALLPLANMLLQAGPDRHAKAGARAARAAAQLAGFAGSVHNQGEALHLMGAALFHCGESQFQLARTAFAAAAEAKAAAGADKPTPAKEQNEQNEAAGMIETLLFLAKLSWELRRPGDADAAHTRALAVGRARLGDAHPATKKALMTFMEMKQKLKALEEAVARANSSPA